MSCKQKNETLQQESEQMNYNLTTLLHLLELEFYKKRQS